MTLYCDKLPSFLDQEVVGKFRETCEIAMESATPKAHFKNGEVEHLNREIARGIRVHLQGLRRKLLDGKPLESVSQYWLPAVIHFEQC